MNLSLRLSSPERCGKLRGGGSRTQNLDPKNPHSTREEILGLQITSFRERDNAEL